MNISKEEIVWYHCDFCGGYGILTSNIYVAANKPLAQLTFDDGTEDEWHICFSCIKKAFDRLLED